MPCAAPAPRSRRGSPTTCCGRWWTRARRVARRRTGLRLPRRRRGRLRRAPAGPCRRPGGVAARGRTGLARAPARAPGHRTAGVAAMKVFEYAALRGVPRVERGESMNVGVIVYCQAEDFLGCRTHVAAARLRVLGPGL